MPPLDKIQVNDGTTPEYNAITHRIGPVENKARTNKMTIQSY